MTLFASTADGDEAHPVHDTFGKNDNLSDLDLPVRRQRARVRRARINLDIASQLGPNRGVREGGHVLSFNTRGSHRRNNQRRGRAPFLLLKARLRRHVGGGPMTAKARAKRSRNRRKRKPATSSSTPQHERPPLPPSLLVSRRIAASLLGCSTATIRRLEARGFLHGMRLTPSASGAVYIERAQIEALSRQGVPVPEGESHDR
jgi:hypothetical protein